VSQMRYRILLVEDDIVDRQAFELMVRRENLYYRYKLATSLSQAREILESQDFDLVVTDYLLGDGTGFEVMKLLEKTPVIFTTGAGDEETAVKAMKSGACDYLIKDIQKKYLHVLPVVISNAIKNKTASERLERTHRQNKQILEAIPVILIGIGSNYRVSHWNKAAEKAFGISQESVKGRPFLDCPIQWDWNKIAGFFSDYSRQNQTLVLENIHYRTTDNRMGSLTIRLSPFSDNSKSVSGFLLLAEDISNQKILQNQVKEAQKMRSIGQLAAGIVDEINIPAQKMSKDAGRVDKLIEKISSLCSENGHVRNGEFSRFKRKQASFEQAFEPRKNLRRISRYCALIKAAIKSLTGNIEHFRKVVQSMKELAHSREHREELVDINKAINSTVRLCRSYWKQWCDVVTDFDSELPKIPGIPGDIHQIILNLLLNAADAIADKNEGGRKGLIRIRTLKHDSEIQIQVCDNGSGISEPISARIFEPFFSTKKPGNNFGQGLAICESLVDKIGGMITLESKTGLGSTFTVHLRAKNASFDSNKNRKTKVTRRITRGDS